MKLSNQQIQALAEQLAQEKNTQLYKENVEKFNKAKKEKRVIDLVKAYHSIPKKLKSILRNYGADEIQNKVIVSFYPKLEYGGQRVSACDVRAKIIIASIDASSIEEIKKKIKF